MDGRLPLERAATKMHQTWKMPVSWGLPSQAVDRSAAERQFWLKPQSRTALEGPVNPWLRTIGPFELLRLGGSKATAGARERELRSAWPDEVPAVPLPPPMQTLPSSGSIGRKQRGNPRRKSEIPVTDLRRRNACERRITPSLELAVIRREARDS
jgi:hypothetical protein